MADTGILYGETATYKTTNAGFAAEWFYEATKGSTGRLISADAQGWTILQPYIDSGILEPYNLLSSDTPEYTLRKLSAGNWHEGDPNGPLVRAKPGTFGPGKVGWYIVDTLAGIGDCLMHRLRQTQQPIGQDTVGKWSVKVGQDEEKFCNNPPAHYGWVQREVVSWMRDMSGLPVASILYISHESKGESDDPGKLPIRGPSLVGTAATARIPKDLGYCIHMEAYAQEVEEPGTKIKRSESLVRGFFENHPDPNFPNIMYKCNARLPVEGMAALKERGGWPSGYFVAGREHGLDEFLRLRYEVAKELSGSKTAWRASVDARLKGETM